MAREGKMINNKGEDTSDDAPDDAPPSRLRYHRGFGNHFESEAILGALPLGRNNPRLVPCNLYTEQLSGTAFTSPRSENRRTWLYRTKPSACGTSSHFSPCGKGGTGTGNGKDQGQDEGGSTLGESLPRIFGWADWSRDMRLDPNPMRWGATPLNGGTERIDDEINFLRGVHTLLGSGDPTTKSGICIYVYAFNADMSPSGVESKDESMTATDVHLYNSDGDFLIVPQRRTLGIQTELGKMEVGPGEICVIPRGIVFAVNISNEIASNRCDVHPVGGGKNQENDEFARGYILEIFRGHFQLPELGPIGSNGLANARDFLHPVAHYESDDIVATKPCYIVNKFGQSLFIRTSTHSPYNVVAWQGNYLPFKYDLHLFCAINSVTYDHPDPSIYTVLTAKGGDEDGTALADFVIFPCPRIMATDENTFRPPWFHRNVMTEFMGLIYGEYDAKKSTRAGGGGGFVPGGASLHPVMTPHGPDIESYAVNVKNPCERPSKFDGGLAFMFETSAMCMVSRYALESQHRELDYARCWDGFP